VHAFRVVAARSEAPAGAPESSKKPPAEKPSIAVLPFANMSGDPEQEYFADGISEDIITGLSKLRWFFVIARNSSFAYKGKVMDMKRIARELAVRYVLEGSVRKGGKRVRITAQLIDAQSGNHLWAQRYDGDLTDVFALQDEITQKVVAAIEPRLLEAEGIRSQNRSPTDIGAWDMVIQANSLFWRLNRADGEEAIAMLRRAVAQHPDYAPAHSMLAFMLLVSGYAWNIMGSQPGSDARGASGATGRQRPVGASCVRLRGLHAQTHRRSNGTIPARARDQSELRRRPWLSRLGAFVRRTVGPGPPPS
jgi:TolB-like protein